VVAFANLIRITMATTSHDITGLLRAWRGGDDAALARLVPVVYGELRRRARHYMNSERPDHTLQPTALVNEVYLRLVDCKDVNWNDRMHFFAVCARQMRHILTDLARARRYSKRGGSAQRVTLNTSVIMANKGQPDLAELDDALKTLRILDARKSDVVEMRFFGGLSVKETAAVLDVSVETVMRDWKFAKVWLVRELSKVRRHGS
jgi:RNA polymerase sigma-70 factor, ECF subfamily